MLKERVVSATEFKAKCLSLLDEVEQTGMAITVTKRGRRVATIGPARKTTFKSLKNSWAGKIEIHGDIVHTDPVDLWEAARDS
jgi:prevent-host-death family protein